MEISGKIKNIGRFRFASWRSAMGTVCLVLFLVVLGVEGWVVKRNADIMKSATQVPVGIKTTKGVRIDFGAYDAAVKRISGAATYVPTATTTQNPFQAVNPAPEEN